MVLEAFDNAGIAVSDVPRAMAFYCDVLGMTDEGHDEENGSVRVGDSALWIFRSAVPATQQRGTDFTANPIGLDHLSFRVPNLDAAIATLEQRGAVFEGPIVGDKGEFRYRGLRDPDGTMIYVVERPAS